MLASLFYDSSKGEGIFTTEVSVFMPAYAAKFSCKCEKCRTVCCHGWQIRLTGEEYARLATLECPSELRRRLDESFVLAEAPTPDAWAFIRHGENGRCPLVLESGLCALHASCGPEVLPAVCRRYPRAIHPGHPTRMTTADSCEATVELLIEEPSPLPFVTVTGTVESGMPDVSEYTEEEWTAFREAVSVLTEPGEPLSRRVVKLCRQTDETFVPPCDLLPGFRKLLLVHGRENSSISGLSGEALSLLGMENAVTDEARKKLSEIARRFRKNFPEGERWTENLLVNHLFFTEYPRRAFSHTAWARGFFAVYVLLSLLTACHTAQRPTKEAFVDAAAALFRRVEHGNFYEHAEGLWKNK